MAEDSKLPKPLEGRTVIDVTTALAGPYATLVLAGLGARVIKIENPDGGEQSRNNSPYLGKEGVKLARDSEDDMSLAMINRSRNKLGVTLNLKHPKGRGIFNDLAGKADILVENFSRGTMDRLGVGYSAIRAINPRMIYCSITGFGTTGEAGEGTGKAMDAIVQALSGLMLTSGLPDDPPIRVGVPFGDLIAPLFGVVGILAALDHATRTGQGQHVDVSMLGALSSLVGVETFDAIARLGRPTRTGLRVPRLAMFGVFRAGDGYVAICAPKDDEAAKVFTVMGQPDLIKEERFRTRDSRVLHAQALNDLVEQWTTTLPSAEVAARLERGGVAAAEVRSPAAAMRDPRVVERGESVLLEHPIFGPVGDVYGMGLPIHFSDSWAGFDLPAPKLGEHNAAIYGNWLGYSQDRIATLHAEGVI